MRHKSHTKVLSKWQIKDNSQNLQNRLLLRNSEEIMLFSIFSGIYDRLFYALDVYYIGFTFGCM